jgi:radical SAM protein with 4Fe4S-binding SPASM domain
VSLDGLRTTNDRFRGVEGAFDEAMEGIRACLRAGVKVGLRYTLTRDNVADLPGILDLLETESIPRACFYHLVNTGRGSQQADLLPQDTRAAVDQIIDRAARLHRLGRALELLTVANHADGPYLYLRMCREGHPGAARALELLRRCGGNSSGVGIGCIGWDGAVYPDQFWRQRILGNIREKPFSRIWSETAATPFFQALKEKEKHVTGRCARCRFLTVCGGNMRSRAEVATGDIWAPDPACYLTDEEIRAEGGEG